MFLSSAPKFEATEGKNSLEYSRSGYGNSCNFFCRIIGQYLLKVKMHCYKIIHKSIAIYTKGEIHQINSLKHCS